MSHTSENNASKASSKFSPNRCDIASNAMQTVCWAGEKKGNNMFANKSKILEKSIIMFGSLSLAREKNTQLKQTKSRFVYYMCRTKCVWIESGIVVAGWKSMKKKMKIELHNEGKKWTNEQTRNTHKPKSGSHNYGLVRRFNPIYISNVCNFRTTVVQVVEKNGKSNNAHAEQPYTVHSVHTDVVSP